MPSFMNKDGVEQLVESVEANGSDKNRLFPVFLKLEKLHVLLIGAGKVGLEKLEALLKNSPATKISIIATQVSAEVKALADSTSTITIEERQFETADLEGKDLVVIAINDKAESLRISELSREKKILVNVADTPDQCDFYLSSIVQKGQLKIAISTNGQSPTAAKRIKEMLQHSTLR